MPPASLRNTGSGKRSNQVLGGEVSSDSAAFTGTNSVPLDVLVDWTNHACALNGSVLGSLEDADTAVDVSLAGTIVNEPPTASAAATPRTVECTSPDATDVTLDGSASSDPENNIALFAWRRDSRTGADIGGDPVVHVTQPLGVTQPYVLAVVDTAGQASADTTAVTVLDSTGSDDHERERVAGDALAAESRDGAGDGDRGCHRHVRRGDLHDREHHRAMNP